jgi:hypothetical protein
MKTIKTACALIAAAAVSIAALPASAGILWSDSHYESVNIPLESYALGMARVKYYQDNNRTDRAIAALQRVAKKWPTAEAHAMLSKSFASIGDAQRAEAHAKVAQQYAAGAEPVATVD